MDRQYFANKIHQERQHEIEKRLTLRRMLNAIGGETSSFNRHRTKRLLLRSVPVMVIFTILLLYFL